MRINTPANTKASSLITPMFQMSAQHLRFPKLASLTAPLLFDPTLYFIIFCYTLCQLSIYCPSAPDSLFTACSVKMDLGLLTFFFASWHDVNVCQQRGLETLQEEEALLSGIRRFICLVPREHMCFFSHCSDYMIFLQCRVPEQCRFHCVFSLALDSGSSSVSGSPRM